MASATTPTIKRGASETYSAEDVAAFLGVDRTTLYRIMKRGELPEGIKIGRRWRFPAHKINARFGFADDAQAAS